MLAMVGIAALHPPYGLRATARRANRVLREIARLAGSVSRSEAVAETKLAARKNQFRQALQPVHPVRFLSPKYFSFVFSEYDVNSVRPAAA
jgi:hypothetical protein